MMNDDGGDDDMTMTMTMPARRSCDDVAAGFAITAQPLNVVPYVSSPSTLNASPACWMQGFLNLTRL